MPAMIAAADKKMPGSDEPGDGGDKPLVAENFLLTAQAASPFMLRRTIRIGYTTLIVEAYQVFVLTTFILFRPSDGQGADGLRNALHVSR
jgi:hypothetical protein